MQCLLRSWGPHFKAQVKGRTDSKSLANAGFPYTNNSVTASVFRDTIQNNTYISEFNFLHFWTKNY
jgi:hypothetical protein